MLNAVQPGDLIEIVCPMTSHQGKIEGEDEDGLMSFYIEVRKCRKNREETVVEGICEGEMVQIEATKQLRIKHLGHWPRLSDSWVKNNSHLQKALKDLRKKQADTRTLPSEIINACASDEKQCGFRLQHVTSLPEFRSLVSADTSYWCDGVGPDNRQPTSLEIAMQTTGELLAFVLGARGVMVVQLDVGYDLGSVRVPLLRPFVLQCLQEALIMKGVCVFPSVLDTKSTASSMVLASKAQPYQSWGRHLAKLGVQASIVADSPYYKYLIGMILGYKEENIIHHITSTGQRLEGSVMAAARQELEDLNPTPPCLPKKRSMSNYSSRRDAKSCKPG
jgi:hypothetical protein